MKSESLEKNIKRLKLDMEAELATIRARYEDKINEMASVLEMIQIIE